MFTGMRRWLQLVQIKSVYLYKFMVFSFYKLESFITLGDDDDDDDDDIDKIDERNLYINRLAIVDDIENLISKEE
jgi:hypothetical protein